VVAQALIRSDRRFHLTRRIVRRQPTRLALGLVLILGGCLPIHWREPLSPAVVGVFRDEAGRPVAGVRVGVATQYGGQSCARPAVDATTDSAGGFRLPATERRHRFLPLVNFGLELRPYSFCAGGADTLRLVFRGERSWRGAQQDSIACIQNDAAVASRVRCYGFYAWDGEHRRRVDSVAAGRVR
jgi:hypothetical protein